MSSLRPARDDRDDSYFIYQLSMDPSVLSVSTRGQTFSLEQHAQWYARRIKDSRIFIIDDEDGPVGYVRWGEVGQGEWEVAIAIAPEHRRKDHATRALLETQPMGTAIALVLVGNDASMRLFESCGYKLVGWEERMGKQHARYEKR